MKRPVSAYSADTGELFGATQLSVNSVLGCTGPVPCTAKKRNPPKTQSARLTRSASLQGENEAHVTESGIGEQERRIRDFSSSHQHRSAHAALKEAQGKEDFLSSCEAPPRQGGRSTAEMPVNKRLFTQVLVEGSNALLAQIRLQDETSFVSQVRKCGECLGLRAVHVNELVFLLSSVLGEDSVNVTDAQYLFAFANWNDQGYMEFKELLRSLRVLFRPPEVVPALCLKRLLKTRHLDNHLVSIDEALRMLNAVVRLFSPLFSEVHRLCDEVLERLATVEVDFCVPAVKLCETVLSAPALAEMVQKLLQWDGTIRIHRDPREEMRRLIVGQQHGRLPPKANSRHEENEAVLEFIASAYEGGEGETKAEVVATAMTTDPTHAKFVADKYINLARGQRQCTV